MTVSTFVPRVAIFALETASVLSKPTQVLDIGRMRTIHVHMGVIHFPAQTSPYVETGLLDGTLDATVDGAGTARRTLERT